MVHKYIGCHYKSGIYCPVVFMVFPALGMVNLTMVNVQFLVCSAYLKSENTKEGEEFCRVVHGNTIKNYFGWNMAV